MNDKPKKTMVQIQGFRPKNLKRVMATAKRLEGHPDLEDIKNMAKDTIELAPEFISDKKKLTKQIKDAEHTIKDVNKAKVEKERP